MNMPPFAPGVIDILVPAEQKIPFVFASPHSGSNYPPDFVHASALDPASLRKSEDIYVDQIFALVVACGAPLLRALFPRAVLDPNREPYELDPAMFEETLPAYVNARSPRVAAGLGTIAKVVANGASIYAGKLRFAEAERRINTFYHPYHRALRHLIETTRQRFGCCVVIDCHSMPSIGGPMDADPGLQRVDFVLGDCFSLSCARAFTATAERTLKAQGYQVTRNRPYAGGYTTRRYGQPIRRQHALQIEINRKLYVDEMTYAPLPELDRLKQNIAALVQALAAVPGQERVLSAPVRRGMT
ncbi:MAG: N-formylglutamate amidohydrolase [Rhodospirillaceae bacterium]|nr:MAG: N-formylglutamate amidohydrolase [Rhodospirillaceae bacterium]